MGPHPPEHVLDHAVEAQLAAVFGAVDLLDAVGFERGDLIGRDGAATAHHHADVLGLEVAQHVHHVTEVLVVPALVGADGYAVGIFLNRRADDVRNAAVMPKVDHLGAVRLQDAANDVDGRVMTVE